MSWWILGELMIALVAVNAKYCHTSLAVRSLGAYLKSKGFSDFCISEFTINDTFSKIIKRLALEKADIYAFSCYIWNIEIIKKLCVDLKKIKPECSIWLGGPEVSFDENEYPFADKIICGEGEDAMLRALSSDERVIRGEAIQNLDNLPFAYIDLEKIGDRLVYYESSRGCPFNCSYCLSSVTKGVRFKSLDKVFEELKRFDDAKVPLVKFVDRTFNANPSRADRIWQFIRDNTYNTSFHFEVEGELLTKSQIELIKSFPEGKIQLEIGVQSTNEKTLSAVNRKSDIHKLLNIIKSLSEKGNVHIHTDLIAGLPCESYERFKISFNDLYKAKPHCIQLGFLKLLKGSDIRENAHKWGYRFSEFAPYTVYYNDDISFSEIKMLEDIAYIVDKVYNSGCFEASLSVLVSEDNPFEFYQKLYYFMEQRGLFDRPLSRKYWFEILFEFSGHNEHTAKYLKLDYLEACGRPCPVTLGKDEPDEIAGFEDKYNKVIKLFNKNKLMR